MNMEDTIFQKSVVDLDKLLLYGFQKEGDKYFYCESILDNTFQVIVEVDYDKKVKGKIIELTLKEEYLNFRIESMNGEFVNQVRKEFERILVDIKNHCFQENYFISHQANRISNFMIKTYNSQPEFLWKKYSNYGVFRNLDNKKWYAIIMNIPKNKIAMGTEEVEIINIKLSEFKIVELLSKKGFYKAYHMNKKHWISIILDDTLTDEEIMGYITESYLLTQK